LDKLRTTSQGIRPKRVFVIFSLLSVVQLEVLARGGKLSWRGPTSQNSEKG